MRYLSHDAARRLYSLIGRLEDSQSFYEAPALDQLVRMGGFEHAGSVLEFGCGTGRLAERLLRDVLPSGACYVACDVSPRMVALSRARLERFGDRVRVFENMGDPAGVFGGRLFDRIVTSYVLDLLSPADSRAFLDAAAKALTPGGSLCAASITPGHGFPAAMVSTVWGTLNRLSPVLTGGCRPIDLAGQLSRAGWRVDECVRVQPWGVASCVVTARPAGGGAPPG